jgi:hypothetical protein
MNCPQADDSCENPITITHPTRWEAMASAIGSFVDSPAAAGIGAGIGFFGLQDTTTSCSVTSYATPTVSLAPLPANAAAIKSAIAATMPGGGTPTAPALQGAIEYARTYTMQAGAHQAAVVLVTDGAPTGCGQVDVMPAVAVAQAGYTGTPQVRTFVVGMGKTSALDQVALAGSGGTAHYIPTQGDVAGTLLAALDSITGMATCAYSIPTLVGTPLDPTLVNLYVGSSTSPGRVISRVVDAMSCTATGGWYYDAILSPRQILLCPATCDALRASTTAQVRIGYGCPTILG